MPATKAAQEPGIDWIVRSGSSMGELTSDRVELLATGSLHVPKNAFRVNHTGTPILCGSKLRFEHATSNKILCVNGNNKAVISEGNEITCLEETRSQDCVFAVKCLNSRSTEWSAGDPVVFENLPSETAIFADYIYMYVSALGSNRRQMSVM